MSERVRRYLASRRNAAGMAGALVGVGLHAVGVIGDVWPVVAIGLYGVGVLVGPAEPAAEPPLTELLRADANAVLARADSAADELPPGTVATVVRVVEVVRRVLHRLDQVADRPADRIAAPERLATAAEIVRIELPECLDTYLGRAPSTPQEPAGRELRAQLDLIAARAERLAEQVPDLSARRAADLTEEMRRRHGQQ